jgi:NADH-ubiquinone oxidoreductase chain 4
LSLVPTLILIIGWGYQPERLEAGIYIMVYTISASLPLFLIILFLFKKEGCVFISMGYFSGVAYFPFVEL